MLVRFIWKDCDLCDADTFWLEATEKEARERIFPLLNDDTIAASEKLAEGSKAFATIMGHAERTFCFLVSDDIQFIQPFKAGYPVHQLWNGYSPFEEIDPIEIIQLSEIKNALESTQKQQPLDPMELEDAITTCALRFMGYEYWEERHHAFEGAHSGDFSALTTDLIKTGRLHDNENDNLCAFFILQRYLCKWGGEQLREDSPERIAYYRLFLYCYKLEIPDAFKHTEYQGKWMHYGLKNHETIADQVRQKKLPTPHSHHAD